MLSLSREGAHKEGVVAKVRELTVRVPDRVAARVSRFIEEAEAMTLESFIEQRIGELARGLPKRPQEEQADPITPVNPLGYL